MVFTGLHIVHQKPVQNTSSFDSNSFKCELSNIISQSKNYCFIVISRNYFLHDLLQVIDGFNYVDSHKRILYSLPEHALDHPVDLCQIDENDLPKTIELSQNAGQISYKLGKLESILVNIDFTEAEPSNLLFCFA